MLVRDAPLAIDPTQSDCQPEKKSASRKLAVFAPAATHDSNSKGDVLAGSNLKLLDIEFLRGLVVLKEQVPCLLVLLHAFRLQRRRYVEHHDVLPMMSKNTGQIMPPDCVCPWFDKRLYLTFGGFGLLHLGSHSSYLPELVLKAATNVGVNIRYSAFF